MLVLITGLVLPGLSACQSSTPADTLPNVEKAPAVQNTSTTAAPTSDTRQPDVTIETARIPPEPERVYPDPAVLAGAGVADVINLLGEPGFIRRDHPAEIWQYRGQSCTLDIFLYQAITGIPHKVDYIEARPKSGEPTSNKDCLVSILKDREKPS